MPGYWSTAVDQKMKPVRPHDEIDSTLGLSQGESKPKKSLMPLLSKPQESQGRTTEATNKANALRPLRKA